MNRPPRRPGSSGSSGPSRPSRPSGPPRPPHPTRPPQSPTPPSPPSPLDTPGSPGTQQNPPDPASGPSRGFTGGTTGAPTPSVVVRGTLRRIELESRPLVLDADDGTTWELLLPPGWVLEAEPGARVTVSGDAATDVATTSMVGSVLRVRSLSRGD